MFEPHVALASLSGESDAEWAAQASEWVGAAFLGGLALDEPTRTAAREMVRGRDRSEFLPADPLSFLEAQLDALADVDVRPGFNVRSIEDEPLRDAAEICADHDAILEVNAHCRQPEMTAVGAGQALLGDPERLAQRVRTAAETGVTVSVKVRTEVEGVDLPAVCEQAVDGGADVLHVDAMDSESKIAAIENRTDAFVIANNEVRDRRSVREYLEYGADAVSVARPSTEPTVMERVHDAMIEYGKSD